MNGVESVQVKLPILSGGICVDCTDSNSCPMIEALQIHKENMIDYGDNYKDKHPELWDSEAIENPEFDTNGVSWCPLFFEEEKEEEEMTVKTYDNKREAELREDDIVIPNMDKYYCPVCSSPPKLNSTCLDKENTPLDHDHRLLRVKCSNKECDGCNYTPKSWIRRYEKIRDRWWNPPTPDERLALIARNKKG